MENWFCSGWHGEDSVWRDMRTLLGNETSSHLLPWLPSLGESSSYVCLDDPFAFRPWEIPFDKMVEEDNSGGAAKSHSQAEKRRRDRINAHLSTLRKLVPKSDKMDKAALLGSVVEHVKDLKRKASEVSRFSNIPTDTDEVIIKRDEANEPALSSNNRCSNDNRSKREEASLIRASICCDDRPELFAELNNSIRGLKLTTVQADMTTMGGRVKCQFVLCAKDCEKKGSVETDKLMQSLKMLLNRIVASTSANYHIKSKRQRLLLPYHN